MIDYTTLLKKLSPTPDGQPSAHLRTGVVDDVNSDGTLDIVMSGGSLVTNVPKLAHVYAVDNQVVQILVSRGSMLVLGPVGDTAPSRTSTRVATMTPRTTDSSTITTTETTIDTITASLITGRTYKLVWSTGYTCSVAADTAFLRLRENSFSGTQLTIMRGDSRLTNGAGSRWPAWLETEYTAVATGSKTFVGTLVRASGSGNTQIIAGATYPSRMYVDYVQG